MSRTVEVDHERLARWCDGFVERHGAVTLEVVDGVPRLLAADGVTVDLAGWGRAPSGEAGLSALVDAVAPPARLGLLLVRRGGYAVALGVRAEVVARKVGRRHVQSRTAAGGWSQQRFARRRGNQADALVEAVAGHAAALLGTAALDGLVRGGDRTLVSAVLSDPRLARLGDLPSRDLYDLPDPSPAVLATALRRARAVRLTLSA